MAATRAEESGETFSFVSQDAGERLDRALAALGEWSRSQAQRLIEEGRVTVDGQAAHSASLKLRAGQRIDVRVPPPGPVHVEPEDIALAVVFEDEDLLVVDKARGMVVHPAPGHARGTLVAAVLGHAGRLPGIGGELRPGIVHRIDKDTSGLLVVAKTPLAHESLSAQFKEHSVTRVYEAIVHGVIAEPAGRVEAPIGRDPRDRQRMAVVDEKHGRRAVTHFRVVERFAAYTHVELRLETGRTHQIRVHMAYIGHPVAGDPLYARRDPLSLGGQALHARTLGFTHPRTGERLTFCAPAPAGMADTLQRLRGGRDAAD
jgi:23S rRNA pseudouridine1911/1915/1917 synthase